MDITQSAVMVEPLSVVTTILSVVQLIGGAASTASRNKDKCLELADRVKSLGDVLPSLAYYDDMGTARVMERLSDALGKALVLVQSCEAGGVFSGKYGSNMAAELDGVGRRINNCIMDLGLIGQARANKGAAAAGLVPAAQTCEDLDSGSYYQAPGGASGAHVGSPSLQHATRSVSQGYNYQPHGAAVNVPGPAFYTASPAPSVYTASPAPSGYDLSSFYTLPTLNKIFHRVCDGFH